ncbi:LLM class flavin-dependent oxidoreductase [Celeribacter indicus]|uniref:Alkanesulfonate monooxygenase n=1 Tax=Celeribacter indicus TaxID=1208324 RepID=A0A0B5DSY6_9RHOB|nr:LLM class flavin-dependent oxidoreductase [Celeribacter indicus]AJE46149.1 alkanesulfonate monooxygenase [Celeribacter indicus]SDX36825.1 alkanesulfonate monooxygenase [Celeribacter indicus]
MPIELRARLSGISNQLSDQDSDFDRQAAYYGLALPRTAFDAPHFQKTARSFEDAGFDSALIAQTSASPDVWVLSALALAATDNLRIASAHRVGLQAPTLAARSLATLDRYSGGRTSVHIIQGSTNADQSRDGDHLPKEERYRRSAEFLDIFVRELTATEPFDYEGEFYRVTNARSDVLPIQLPHPPISSAGSSQQGIELAARYSSTFAITGEPIAGTVEILDKVRAASAKTGRRLKFWRDTNVIVAETDDAAWQKAERIRDRILASGKFGGIPAEAVGRQRIVEAAQRSDRHDRALFTGISVLFQGGVGPAFVGSVETVTAAVMDYYDLGIETFSIGLPAITEEDRALRHALLRSLRQAAAERDASTSTDTVREEV